MVASQSGLVDRDAALSPAHQLSAQDEALDRVVPAVDLFGVVGQPDRLADRALFQGLPRTFDLEILDQDQPIPIDQHVAGRVAHDHIGGPRRRGHQPLQAPGTYLRQLCCSLKPRTVRILRFDKGASRSPIARVTGVLGANVLSTVAVGSRLTISSLAALNT